MEELRIESFTINPRSIKSDYYEGKLTKPERNLLYWLRACGSPYGIATVNMEGLADDTFNDSVSKNYINKLLLSLKSKRYVWYSDRTGRRGSFEVHMGDWILPSKHIKNLSRYFDDVIVRGEKLLETIGTSEVEPEIEEEGQSFQMPKTVANKGASIESIKELLRVYDNDKDKEKNKDKESLASLPSKNRNYGLRGFIPTSVEEERCLQIARLVGDEEVGFNLGIYRKYSLVPLEEALVEFEQSDGLGKDNPPAFFNSLVQEQLLNSGVTASND